MDLKCFPVHEKREGKKKKSARHIEAHVISRTSARGPQIRRW